MPIGSLTDCSVNDNYEVRENSAAEVSEVLCLGPVYYSSFSSDLPRRGSAPQFPPSRGVMGARSPHSEGVSLIC